MSGEARINVRDLVPMGLLTTRWGDSHLLHLLKKKGAPIVGTVDPVPDFENYEWTQKQCQKTGDLIFTWEQKAASRAGERENENR